MLDLLLPTGLGALPPGLTECADTLAQVAAALQLSDTSPAALAAAALQAACDAQRVQDQEVGLALGVSEGWREGWMLVCLHHDVQACREISAGNRQAASN